MFLLAVNTSKVSILGHVGRQLEFRITDCLIRWVDTWQKGMECPEEL
jgi:hypothetical protein